MTISDETLMAFVDGELSPEEMSRVEAVLRQQPELEAIVEQQRALRHELHASFASIMNAPLPDALRHTAMNAPVSLQWRVRHALRSLFAPRALIWTGIPAAALACGVVVGVLLDGGSSALMNTQGNALVARGSLANALNQQLASAETGQGPKIGISFRDKSGRYCRTFNASNLAGVACRDAASWNIAALSESPKESTGAYATAGSAMPDLVRNAVQGMIEGSPLNAAAEKQARDQGWKAQ
ncbi:MAG TPA: hypothetical protein VGT78_03600 [Rhizomicrobium sp.]|nr:hypothetical protein [Rhizomicrobium sp.]